MNKDASTAGNTSIMIALMSAMLLAGVMVVTTNVAMSARKNTADQKQILTAQYAAEAAMQRAKAELGGLQQILSGGYWDTDLMEDTTTQSFSEAMEAVCTTGWTTVSGSTTNKPLLESCKSENPTEANMRVFAEFIKPDAYKLLPSIMPGDTLAAKETWWKEKFNPTNISPDPTMAYKYNLHVVRLLRRTDADGQKKFTIEIEPQNVIAKGEEGGTSRVIEGKVNNSLGVEFFKPGLDSTMSSDTMQSLKSKDLAGYPDLFPGYFTNNDRIQGDLFTNGYISVSIPNMLESGWADGYQSRRFLLNQVFTGSIKSASCLDALLENATCTTTPNSNGQITKFPGFDGRWHELAAGNLESGVYLNGHRGINFIRQSANNPMYPYTSPKPVVYYLKVGSQYVAPDGNLYYRASVPDYDSNPMLAEAAKANANRILNNALAFTTNLVDKSGSAVVGDFTAPYRKYEIDDSDTKLVDSAKTDGIYYGKGVRVLDVELKAAAADGTLPTSYNSTTKTWSPAPTHQYITVKKRELKFSNKGHWGPAGLIFYCDEAGYKSDKSWTPTDGLGKSIGSCVKWGDTETDEYRASKSGSDIILEKKNGTNWELLRSKFSGVFYSEHSIGTPVSTEFDVDSKGGWLPLNSDLETFSSTQIMYGNLQDMPTAAVAAVQPFASHLDYAGLHGPTDPASNRQALRKPISGTGKDGNGQNLIYTGTTTTQSAVSLEAPLPAIAPFMKMTVAADRFVFISGDLAYSNVPCLKSETSCDKTGSLGNSLGIYSKKKSILISRQFAAGILNTNKTTDIYIHAALIAPEGDFRTSVETDDLGDTTRGYVHLLGLTQTKYTGRLGRPGDGVTVPFIAYARDFSYDDRFNNGIDVPPFIPRPKSFTAQKVDVSNAGGSAKTSDLSSFEFRQSTINKFPESISSIRAAIK